MNKHMEIIVLTVSSLTFLLLVGRINNGESMFHAFGMSFGILKKCGSVSTT